MPTLDAHPNLAVSTVATAPSPATSGTSLVVAAGEGARFGTPPFNVTVWPAGAAPSPANAEILRVTARSTDTLTVTRAQEGTTARSIVVGDQLAATVTGKTLTDIEGAALWRDGTAAMTGPLGLLNTGSLPAAGVPGRLVRRSNDIRGLYVDSGTAWIQTGMRVVNAQDFNTSQDLNIAGSPNGVSIVAATTVLTANGSLVFVSTDVGKYVCIVGAGTAGADFYTTVSAFVSSTQVTLVAAAVTTVANATMWWGHDDGAALNTAASAVPTGGSLYIPDGTYLCATPVEVTKSMHVTGAGAGGTFLIGWNNQDAMRVGCQAGSQNFATNKMFNVQLNGLHFGAKRNQTAGCGLRIGNVGFMTVRGCSAGSALGGAIYDGFVLTSTTDSTFSEIYATGCVRDGMSMEPTEFTSGGATYRGRIAEIDLDSSVHLSANGRHGLLLRSSVETDANDGTKATLEGIHLQQTVFFANVGSAVYVEAVTAAAPVCAIRNLLINAAQLDSSSTGGGFVTAGAGLIDDVILNDVWSSYNTTYAIYLGPTVRDFQIQGGQFILSGLDGVRIDGAEKGTVSGTVSWNNSRTTALANYGIAVLGGAKNVTMSGNRVYNAGKWEIPAQNGVQIGTAAANSAVDIDLFDNFLDTGSGSTPLSLGAGAVRVRRGVNTEAAGFGQPTTGALVMKAGASDDILVDWRNSANTRVGYLDPAGSAAFRGPRIDVRVFGAKNDQKTFVGNGTTVGVSTTNGSTAATLSAGHPFITADVTSPAKRIVIWSGGTYVQNTITALSGNTLTLGSAASATVAFGSASWATDDTAAIQAALTDAQTLGAAVYLPAGSYWVSQLTLDGAGGLVGDGVGTSNLVAFADGDILQVGAALAANKKYGVTLQDFHVLSAGDRTSGAAVVLRNVGNLVVRGVMVSNSHVSAGRPMHGVMLYRGCSQIVLESVRIARCLGHGILVYQDGSTAIDRIIDIWFQDGCRFESNLGNGVYVLTYAGSAIATIEGLYFGQVSLYGNGGAGVRLEAASVGPINNIFLTGTILDTNGTNGLTCAGTAPIGVLRLNDVWASYNTGSNIVLSANVKDYEVAGGFNLLATVHGLSIDRAVNGKVSVVNFLNNNRAAGGSYAINLVNPASPLDLNLSILGNRIYNSTTWANTQNGISIPANVTDVEVSSNFCDTGPGTTKLSLLGADIRAWGNVTDYNTGAAFEVAGSQGTIRATSFEPTQRKTWTWDHPVGANTLLASGVAVPTATGTAASVQNANGDWVGYTTAATINLLAGWTPSLFTQTRLAWGPVLTAVVETGATLTNWRVWVGFTSAAVTGAATLNSLHGIAFRYDTGLGDTTWKVARNNATATAPFVVDSGVAVAASTKYVFRIDASNPAAVQCYINTVRVATLSTSLPTTTQGLGLTICATNLTASVHELRISNARVEALA